jgi:hypothetical protein
VYIFHHPASANAIIGPLLMKNIHAILGLVIFFMCLNLRLWVGEIHMVEIIVTITIAGLAGFILFKSIKNSSRGKCNCDCKGCKSKNTCSPKKNED